MHVKYMKTSLLISTYFLSGDITLKVHPSNDVAVNQPVTLLCELDSNPIILTFKIESETDNFCVLESKNGMCITSSCSVGFNANCPSNTRYSIQVLVPQSWNGESVFCQSVPSGQRSNAIIFRVTGTKRHIVYINCKNR